MKPTYEELEKTVAALRRRVIENDHNRAVIIEGYERLCTEIKQQVAALVAENTALAEFIRLECYVAQIEPETFYESEVTRYVSADGYEPEKPATDAAIAEIRASAITAALCSRSEYLDTDCVMDRLGISYGLAEMRTAGAIELHDSLVAAAKQYARRHPNE